MSLTSPIPRYAPEFPFPSYAFVPGRHPHPLRDPSGHSYGREEESIPAPEQQTLQIHPQFRFAVDLFNAGYYWEAHEVWEGLWHACGRSGELADFLKALIKLAAAGVKARVGNPVGVSRHAERARELFAAAAKNRLAQMAMELRDSPPSNSIPTIAGNPVLKVQLQIEDLALA